MFIIFRQKTDDSALIIDSNSIMCIKETKLNGNLIIYLTNNQNFEVKNCLKDIKHTPLFKHMFE